MTPVHISQGGPTQEGGLEKAAAEAAAKLVCLRRSEGSVFINLPLLYPDSSFVTLKLDVVPDGIRVSDNGFAYRELEAIGACRSFAKTAATVSTALDVEANRRALFVDVPPDQLVRAICDVAMASWQVADRVYARAADTEAAELEDCLQNRLMRVFGEHLRPIHSIKGASSSEWDVSAVVEHHGKLTVFHAVSNHANAVFRTSAAFHDLASRDRQLNLVSVVKEKAALGARYGILSQAGRVIEEAQPDSVYIKAAA